MTIMDLEDARARGKKLFALKQKAEGDAMVLGHHIGDSGNGWKPAPDGRRYFTYCKDCDWMCIVDGAKDAPTGKVLVEQCRGKSRR